MDAPHRQFNALCIEHLLPCKDVLIDAVNERAIEIKQENRFDTLAIPPVLELRCYQRRGVRLRPPLRPGDHRRMRLAWILRPSWRARGGWSLDPDDLGFPVAGSDHVADALSEHPSRQRRDIEIEPLAGSASSSPTIRNVCSLPSSRTIVTEVPNRTSEWSVGAGTTRAVARRADQ